MIEKVFNGAYLKRLDNIVQWSEKDVFTRETVSSHSYKVTVFCRVLLEEIFRVDNDSIREFKMNCVTHAMFHDWDEALLLRDISHETKYNEFNGDKIRAELDEFCNILKEYVYYEHNWIDKIERYRTMTRVVNCLTDTDSYQLVHF